MSQPQVIENPGSHEAPRQETAEVVVDDAGAPPTYTNFCRVTATPEEAILDFGLNAQPFSAGTQNVKASLRVVMNFYTAKRLLAALEMTVRHHQNAFGVVELDVRRRAGLGPHSS